MTTTEARRETELLTAADLLRLDPYAELAPDLVVEVTSPS